MKTLAQLFPLPPAELQFAGFSFPRHIAMLPRGDHKERIRAHTQPLTGPYYRTPLPNCKYASFYLNSDFAPKLRWKAAEDVANIGHSGWFLSGGVDTVEGIVMRLPKGRGFLAGWSMGERMASGVATDRVYATEEEAGFAADDLAYQYSMSEEEQDRGYEDEAA